MLHSAKGNIVDIFNMLMEMDANEILSYRFMSAVVGCGKLIKELKNAFVIFLLDFGAKP